METGCESVSGTVDPAPTPTLTRMQTRIPTRIITGAPLFVSIRIQGWQK